MNREMNHRSVRTGSRWLARALSLLVITATGCMSSETVAQPATETGATETPPPLYDPATMDPAIPTPESVIGHAVGDGAVRYERLVDYLEALAAASPLVTLSTYAQSHEGRTLYHLTITSEANHARLDEIRSANGKLADPRTLANDAEAMQLIESMPATAWLAYSIHGDELSSTDAALLVAYHLAAGQDDATRLLREQLVVHIDPLQNPDGRERYLAQLQTLTGKVPNPDFQAMQHSGLWSAGRGNHYLFDLNRDWPMQVHPETRGRAARILSWHPHLLVDSHEMGGLDTYLFDPPRQPINSFESETSLNWRRRFSADQARAFDAHGWSYYTQEWYEEWYPGYTNSWANLTGAIALLYEQAGVNAASLTQPSGEELTYREAVHHHYVSSMANIETLRSNRTAILRDYLTDRRWAVSGDPPHHETFIMPPSADRSTMERFADVLQRQGIEFGYARHAFRAREVTGVRGETIEEREFAMGSIIVRSNQPHRRLLHALLEFDQRMPEDSLVHERTELENRRGSTIYDVTAWNLPMAYGLDASWAGDVGRVETVATLPAGAGSVVDDDAAYGYLIDGSDGDVHQALARLLARGCSVRIASKSFVIQDRTFPPGSVLMRKHENADDLANLIRESVSDLNLEVVSADTGLSENGWDLGGPRFHLLQEPRVAIASQWPVGTTSFGATWYVLDARLGLRVSPINVQNLRGFDLRKYNVLIIPGGFAFSAVLDDSAMENLTEWVEAGGTLIAFSGAASFLADEDRGLSSVRLRRDVLDELDVYAEAVTREQDARAIEIDFADVWGDEPDDAEVDAEADEEDAGDESDKAAPNGDLEQRQRLDAWQRNFSPQGTLVDTSLNPEHWLCYGLGEELPVLISGGSAFMSRPPAQTPVRMKDADNLRLSGLLWPEARARLAETAYATVESRGNGQVILFASDPFFRGYTEGSGRLLFNAVILGPGMGTNPTPPW